MVPSITVPIEVFVIAIAIASALLALWLHVRISRVAPDRVSVVFVHLVGSCVVAKMVLPLVMARLDDVYLSIFLAVIPALMYMFLSIIWAIALAQRVLGGGGGGGLADEVS